MNTPSLPHQSGVLVSSPMANLDDVKNSYLALMMNDKLISDSTYTSWPITCYGVFLQKSGLQIVVRFFSTLKTCCSLDHIYLFEHHFYQFLHPSGWERYTLTANNKLSYHSNLPNAIYLSLVTLSHSHNIICDIDCNYTQLKHRDCSFLKSLQ